RSQKRADTGQCREAALGFAEPPGDKEAVPERRATDIENVFMTLDAEVFALGREEAAFPPIDPRAFDVRHLSLLDRSFDRSVELLRRGLQSFEHLVPVRNDERRRGDRKSVV